jgi:hypothetical protein
MALEYQYRLGAHSSGSPAPTKLRLACHNASFIRYEEQFNGTLQQESRLISEPK